MLDDRARKEVRDLLARVPSGGRVRVCELRGGAWKVVVEWSWPRVKRWRVSWKTRALEAIRIVAWGAGNEPVGDVRLVVQTSEQGSNA